MSKSKIKQIPEDFSVEELTEFFSIKNGPQTNLDLSDIVVKYLGAISSPYDASHLAGNRFGIIIRNINSDQAKKTDNIVQSLPGNGVPNYFDDQRFGSIPSLKTEFIAKKMVLGDFEQALKIALTSPYTHDNKMAKKEKAILIQKWGDWVGLKNLLPRGHSRTLVEYLSINPHDFKGAAESMKSANKEASESYRQLSDAVDGTTFTIIKNLPYYKWDLSFLCLIIIITSLQCILLFINLKNV